MLTSVPERVVMRTAASSSMSIAGFKDRTSAETRAASSSSHQRIASMEWLPMPGRMPPEAACEPNQLASSRPMPRDMRRCTTRRGVPTAPAATSALTCFFQRTSVEINRCPLDPADRPMGCPRREDSEGGCS